MIEFKPHSEKQDTCIFSKKKIIVLGCGIQFGKTVTGALRTKIAMHTYRDKKDAFIIAAPTYKIMQQATLPAFLRLMTGLGEYHKGDAVFEMYKGGIAYLRTGTDPDSVVGITNVRHIWGDEAGLYSLYFHENLQARASFKEAPICYTTSPYSLNWIFTDYIRPRQKDPEFMKDELEIVQASSRENPYFPEAEYERKKATMDPRRFNMIYGGQFHKMEGLVYDVFSEDHHIVQAETLDPRTIFLAGVDWGFTNPSCILVLGVEPSGRVTVVNEYYQAQQTINHMVEVAGRLKKIYGIERFYCDPSSPANILEFNKASLTAIPANNDIRNGVDSTYELIKKDKFRIFSGRAPNLVDELSIYHYPAEPDYNADKDLKEQLPVKQNDHACDALRYVVHGISLTSGAKRDTVGGRQPDMRLHVTDDLLKQRLDDDYDW